MARAEAKALVAEAGPIIKLEASLIALIAAAAAVIATTTTIAAAAAAAAAVRMTIGFRRAMTTTRRLVFRCRKSACR